MPSRNTAVYSRWMRILNKHGIPFFTGLTLFAAPLLSGCATTAEVRQLEDQIDLLAQELEKLKASPNYELRLDSATVAIEKNRERLDGIVPADAQWMPLNLGGSLRWYIDEPQGNAYLQFIDQNENTIQFKVSSQAQTTEHILHPGESSSHRLGPEGMRHHLIITLHRIHHPESGPDLGLFSVGQRLDGDHKP